MCIGVQDFHPGMRKRIPSHVTWIKLQVNFVKKQISFLYISFLSIFFWGGGNQYERHVCINIQDFRLWISLDRLKLHESLLKKNFLRSWVSHKVHVIFFFLFTFFLCFLFLVVTFSSYAKINLSLLFIYLFFLLMDTYNLFYYFCIFIWWV